MITSTILETIHAYLERWKDEKAEKVVMADGNRTKKENDLFHKDDMPMRGFVVALISAIEITIFGGFDILMIACVLAFNVLWFWLTFDIFTAKWKGLKWWQTGTTSKTDQKLKKYHLWIKFVGIGVCIIVYLRLIQII